MRLGARCAAICVLAVLTAAAVGAQSVPTGVQEYYVLGWEQHIWDMMDRVQNGEGGAQFVNGMNSVVTATASADNQVIYYDHWEDGPDAELANFPDVDTSSLQLSTLVIGDGVGGNGDICDFNVNIACEHRHDFGRRLRQLQLRPRPRRRLSRACHHARALLGSVEPPQLQ